MPRADDSLPFVVAEVEDIDARAVLQVYHEAIFEAQQMACRARCTAVGTAEIVGVLLADAGDVG